MRKINKKGQQNDNSGLVIAILAIFVGIIFALYFLSHIIFWIGVSCLVISLILFLVGFSSQEEEFIIIGLVLLMVGVVFLFVGNAGINFFENNPTGKNMLDGANTVVNTTKDSVQAYGELTKIPAG